jgi:hypothetical protein
MLPHKIDYYKKPLSFWSKDARRSFPSAAYDMREAGKCYALGRYTGCAMHVMRVAELGLRLLGADLGVTVDGLAWGVVLANINGALAGKVKIKKQLSKTDELFYSGAATHFAAIKVFWRDNSMHLDQQYDDEGALDIFKAVCLLMAHLAPRLHE